MTFLAKLNWFFREKAGAYILAVGLLTLVNLLNMIPPKIVGDTIDSIKTGDLTRAGLTGTVVLLVALAFFLYGISYVWVTRLFSSSFLLEKVLRGRLLAQWTKMTPSFFHRNRTGDLMALATNDVLAVGQTAGYGVLTLVSTVVGTTVVIVTMILFTSYKLMLASLLPLPLVAYAMGRLGKMMRKRFIASQAAFGTMNDHALESISGMRVIRSYVQETADTDAFERVTTDVMEKNSKVAFIGSLFQPVITSIVGLSFSISLGYGAYLVFHDELSLGQLVAFNIYLGQLIWPMISFGEFINVLQRGTASVERLDNVYAQKTDVADTADPIDLAEPGTIELRELNFRYPGAAADTLSQIRLSVEPGQTIGIVGRTGSGKSTLLKQLLRQYPIAEERLLVSGVPIERIPLTRVRSWIGYVPQEHMLLSKSIRDNIALGRQDASEADIVRAVELASFTRDIAQMKDGLDTIIGENGVMLSGGQKQRVAIARALLAEPDILVLDDALSAVDARTEHAILHHIRETRSGKTTWIATHRLSAVSHAGWIVVLDDGRIVEEGTHDQLMLFGGWYKTQYERQQAEAKLLEEKEG
ncbi:MAG: ATP-binding cassette domain-containing protein [Paenibacillaceae bacterium]|nr:ATP-binding cassette domain-containing protein [Paenibacillaceae bacterium]